MKKYFLSIVALAGMLFPTSCQESMIEPQIEGTTTFTVQLPDQMGTKAIGDAKNVNKLFVQVYQDMTADPLYSVVTDVNGGSAKLQISLIQDQTYNIIFWAQKDDAYVTTNLRSIPMNNNHHNNESGAAFFHYEEGFVPTGAAMAITLKRPFAQLNLGTTTESLTTNLGTIHLTEATSKVVVSNIAESFNTVKGYGEGEQTITFDAEALSTEPLSVSGNTYKYISMDYLPIAGDDQAVVTVKAEINIPDYDVIAHEFTNVPVKENYRTNIVGNLISSTSDFIVTIDDRFVDENGNLNPDNDYLVVDNVYQAQVAFDNGETHVAINSIGNTQTLQLPDNDKELYLQLPDSDGQITIKRDAGNFNISVPDTNPSNTGLTITIDAPNSTVDFTGQATVIYSTTAPNTLNLSGANVGTIVVKKGNVVVENKSTVEELKNQSNAEVTVYVDRTSTVEVPENENFNKVEAPVEIESLEDLQKVLTYSASDVIELSNAITNTSDFILDLKGKTVTAVDNTTGSYGLITNKANLIIEGEGTISLSATNNRGWNAYSSVISNQPGGILTVGEGVVIEHLGGTDMAYGIDNLTNGRNTSAIVTINDATVKSPYRAVRQFLNGVEANNSLTVNSGAVIEGANKSIWMQDPSANANTGTLVVNEGATLDGDVYLFVCAGSTEWPVSVSIAASTVNGKVLTGNVPAGYEVVCENGVWFVRKYTQVSTAKDLVEALSDGQNVIFMGNITTDATQSSGYGAAGVVVSGGAVLEGQEHTLTVNKAWNTWDCAVAAKGGTIKNLTVSGAMRGIFMPGANNDVYIDNVTFKNVIYTFNSDAGSKNYGVYISNSTLNGWTSFSNAHKEVVFTNCKFGKGNGYAFCRPYNSCVFENCEFSTDMEFDTSQVANIVFKNCTYGDVKITAENAASLKTGDVTFFYNGVGSVTFE